MLRKFIRNIGYTIALGLYLSGVAVSASQQVSIEPNSGARTWSTRHAGVYFSLTQILPEQGNAFFVNRGFSIDEIKPFTSACVFMTVLRNDSAPGVIHFVRNNWSVVSKGQPHQFNTVSEWLDYFREQNIGKAALIAFRWAQFPPEQEYEPGGDWNQGMLAVGLPAGESFTISARWDIDGKEFTSRLTGVECV